MGFLLAIGRGTVLTVIVVFALAVLKRLILAFGLLFAFLKFAILIAFLILFISIAIAVCRDWWGKNDIKTS